MRVNKKITSDLEGFMEVVRLPGHPIWTKRLEGIGAV
jgi:hypothetical protein